jgi:PEP-CTERM/exosortase A-associated glycosyltransferase
VRVLHVLDHSLPVHSGYAFRSNAILQAQVKRGGEARALTSPKHGESWTGAWAPEESVRGITYYRTPGRGRSPLPLATEWRLMTALSRRMAAIAREWRPEIIHAHSPILNALPALRVGRRRSLPVVYEMRSLWEEAAVDHGSYARGSWKYRLIRALETRVCRAASHVVVISEGLKAELSSRGVSSERMTVVPNGVDLGMFQLSAPDADFVRRWNLAGRQIIGFMGSFSHYEGLDLLLEAMIHLGPKVPGAVVLLLGGGRMEAQLRRQVAEHDALKERVIIAGRLPQDQLPGIYALTDVLVYPRRSIRLTELVTPLKPLESMAMGKAVVASDVGGHRELIRDGETGLLFRAGDARSLADTLERLLRDAALRSALERRAIDWVRRERPWDRTTSGYAEVYEKAAGRARPSRKIPAETPSAT